VTSPAQPIAWRSWLRFAFALFIGVLAAVARFNHSEALAAAVRGALTADLLTHILRGLQRLLTAPLAAARGMILNLLYCLLIFRWLDTSLPHWDQTVVFAFGAFLLVAAVKLMGYGLGDISNDISSY